MIAQFPQFTSLTQNSRSDIDSITSQFAPYSDFNFTSLFCWDTNDSVEVSNLDGNLVVKMPDYITGEPIYSFIGSHNVNQACQTLLENVDGSLRLVPEVIAEQLHDFNVTEDRDSFDYVYDVHQMAILEGSSLKWKRKRYRRFERDHENISFKAVSLLEPTTQSAIRELFKAWAHERNKFNDDIVAERTAIERLLQYADLFTQVQATLLYVDGKLVGFSLNELLGKSYAVCHFHKTLFMYENADIYFSCRIAQELEKLGCKCINWEQDLGIPGLRTLKLSYDPIFFLKKCTISRTQ
jgi:hypothetical protein